MIPVLLGIGGAVAVGVGAMMLSEDNKEDQWIDKSTMSEPTPFEDLPSSVKTAILKKYYE